MTGVQTCALPIFMPGLSTVSRNMRLNIEGVIQDDDNIYLTCNRGVPIVMKKGTYIEKNFQKILDRILNI